MTTLADGGPGSLRQALADAFTGDTITFSTNGTIRLTSGELFLSNSVDIIGPGASNLAVSGNNASRVFNIPAGVTSSISGLTIRDGRTTSGRDSYNGEAGGPGGGLFNLGTLSLTDCTIAGNTTGNGGAGGDGFLLCCGSGTGGSSGYGGGLYNGGMLELDRCSFIDNRTGAGGNGGNGHAWGTAGGNGGSSGGGGGLYNGSTLRLAGCSFVGNRTGSGGSGGAGEWGMCLVGDPPTEIYGGSGGDGGGGGHGAGIYSTGVVVVAGCTFRENSAGNGGPGGSGGARGDCGNPRLGSPGESGPGGRGGGGGGIWLDAGTNTVSGCMFFGNTCGNGGQGGGGEWPGSGQEWPGDGGPGGAGGGVGNNAVLNLNTCSVSGNAGGAGGPAGTNYSGYRGAVGIGGDGGGIWSRGALGVSACTFSNNSSFGSGGGIFSQGPLSLSVCTLSSNSCYASGGGLHSRGTGIVSACTFDANSARGQSAYGAGGGGLANGGSLTMSNCTVSGNSTSLGYPYYGTGGGIYTTGRLAVVSCTVVSNSAYWCGGVSYYNPSGSVAVAQNSVVADNRASYVPDLDGPFASLGHNLIGDGLYSFTNGASGDLIGDSTNRIKPFLGPLADNGGPTRTHALLAGSPALDAGDDTLTGTDQRGRPRRSGAHVDIGAYEYGFAAPQRLVILHTRTNGVFRFAFTNVTDETYTIITTTNVALPPDLWLNLGPATRVADTLYEFIDPAATNFQRRFYQLGAP